MSTQMLSKTFKFGPGCPIQAQIYMSPNLTLQKFSKAARYVEIGTCLANWMTNSTEDLIVLIMFGAV